MATTQEMLDQAIAARHEIITGTRAVSVSSSSGRSVTFTAASLAALDAYIAQLRRQLGLPTGIGRPITPLFG